MARTRKAQNDTVCAGAQRADPMVWRVAVYVRLSREDGSDESGSVVNQKKILGEYLEQSFQGRCVIADFYVDDGVTGTDDTRADFMRMIQDIERGKVNCVLCKTLARAFRNYSDQGYYLEYYFPQKGVRFISTGDPAIDTFQNPEAITGLEVPITGLMNDRFACRTSGDVRRTFDMKRRKGEFIGAFPPYGYLKDPADKNRLVLDDDVVPIKKAMMGWIVGDGMSLAGVAQKLNELGIVNPTAYKRAKGWHYSNPNAKNNDGLWTGSTVKRVLLDPVNLGHMVQGRQRVVSYKVHDKVAVPPSEWFLVENTHQPTFLQEEYDTLERLLRRDTRAPNGQRSVHLFSGFLRCAGCGKAMQRKSAKGLVYYACRTYAEKSKAKCNRRSIRADLLQGAVLAAIRAQISLLGPLAGLGREIGDGGAAEGQSRRVEKMLREKRWELEKIWSASDSLYTDWRSGEIVKEEYRRMKARFGEQAERLTGALAKLEEEYGRLNTAEPSGDHAFAEFQKHRGPQTLDRGLLAALVDVIEVHEDKEITIHFRFSDEWERMLE